MKASRYFLFIIALTASLGSTPADSKFTDVNQKVIEYVRMVIDKKVGRGECWDLANAALTYANADWKPPFQFGKLIDDKTEKIIPGDIIHARHVVMESQKGNTTISWKMIDHTAILYDIREGGMATVAEQNVNGIRKVQLTEWNLRDVKSGKLQFFRPQPSDR